MKIIKRILVGGIWVVLFLELFIAMVVWARTEIADYDVKAEHAHLSTNGYAYCPYCGEELERGKIVNEH